MSVSETSLPVVLLLGEILFANSEWEDLATIGELRVCPHPDLNSFLLACVRVFPAGPVTINSLIKTHDHGSRSEG